MAEQISLPKEFELRMRATLGSQFDSFLDSLQVTPPTSIRLNPKKKPTHLVGNSIPWSRFGRYLEVRPNFTLDPYFHAGCYYVQEASSMLLEAAVNAINLPDHALVLDLCGAPGGKTTHLLSILSNQSLVVSNEVIRSRANILAENVIKWGYNNAVVISNDPKTFETLPGIFDLIVIDAPCSGEGLFRKDVYSIGEWSIKNAELCSQRQQRIMHDVWPALKSEGYLVYCTCTYNDAENLDNIKKLKSDYDLESIELHLNEDWGVQHFESGNTHGYQCYPHKVRGEGFFISILQKKESSRTLAARRKNTFPAPQKKITDSISDWLLDSDSIKLITRQDHVHAIPSAWSGEIEFLVDNLKTISIGTCVASIKHDKILPTHDLSMSTILNTLAFDSWNVNQEDAIKFLRRDAIDLHDSHRGYALIRFEDAPLGWVNRLGNRCNNLYPKEWRIRLNPNNH